MADQDWTAMGKPKPWPDFPDGVPIVDRDAARADSMRQIIADGGLEAGAFQRALARGVEQARRDAVDEVLDTITPADMAGFANLVDGSGVYGGVAELHRAAMTMRHVLKDGALGYGTLVPGEGGGYIVKPAPVLELDADGFPK